MVASALAIAAAIAESTPFVSFSSAARLIAPPPVTLRLPVTDRAEVLAAGRLTVTMRVPRRVRLRAQPFMRLAGGQIVSLGSARTVTFGRRGSAAVSLPLSAQGRAALAPCPAGRVGVRVSARGLRKPLTKTAPLRRGPPECSRFFGRTAIWNTPLAPDAPLDENSGRVVRDLLAKVAAGYQTNMPPTINTSSYAPPVYTVARGEARVRVRLDAPGPAALAQAFSSVPLPAAARPAPGTDSELVVWQPATDTMWEFWRLRRDSGGWIASWGGRLDHVSRGPGHFAAPHPHWGTTASSLPLAGGMITPRELRSGVIDHALSMALPLARAGQFSLPAQRTDGESSCPYAVPEGARFRLDPALDVESLRLPPPIAALTRAAQRYGIYVRDQSDSVSFYAQSAVSLPADPYPAIFGGKPPYELLRQFPWSRLQLMKMTLRRMPRQDPPIFSPPPLLGGCG